MSQLDLSSWKEFCLKRLNSEYLSIDIFGKKYHVSKFFNNNNKENYQIELKSNNIIKSNFLDVLEKEFKKNEINKIYLRIDPLELNQEYVIKASNLLKKKKFLENKIIVILLNLTKDISELRKNLRKSYKSLINKEEKALNIQFSLENLNKKKLFNDWVQMYSKALLRGNVILDDKTYKLLEKSIDKDECLLTIAYENEQPKGGMLFGLDTLKSRYYAAVNIPSIENEKSRGVGHLLMWKSIIKLKEIKITSLELGSYYRPESEIDDNLKEKSKVDNIIKFKLGFGADKVLAKYFYKLII